MNQNEDNNTNSQEISNVDSVEASNPAEPQQAPEPQAEDLPQAEEQPEAEEQTQPSHHGNPFRAFIILVVAVLIVGGISYLPLEKMTGGAVKDFNLLSDILNIDPRNDTISGGSTDGLDPELVAAMQNAEKSDDEFDDSVLIDIQPLRVGDMVQIEDYTHQQAGLRNLRKALQSGRLARVAVLGDSYVEGDIFTQDLRDQLQTTYGGSGVGYMNLYSEFPGFRRSVKQSGSGWTEVVADKGAGLKYMNLSVHYFNSAPKALAVYKGTTSLDNTAEWDKSKFLFLSKTPTTIRTKMGDNPWEIHTVEGSPEVQCIEVDGHTGDFSVEATSSSVIGLGVWLDANKGISVDCMSTRGYSGMSLAHIDSTLCSQMRNFIDYDLIILEYGINAMTATQKDYSVYINRMAKVVEKIKTCYPNADILIMGVGDRGQKKGGSVESMATGKIMTDSQRDLARRTHTHFFATREAMGGDGAIAQWAKDGLANKDYIHLTHKGGKELATRLSKAIEANINK